MNLWADNYDEIKETLKMLQEKVEKLEKENQELKGEIKEPDENKKHIEILDNISKYAAEEMEKIFEVNNSITAASICISKSRTVHSNDTNITSTCIKSFDEINEEKLSNAVEAFTNPRRIAILKVLIAECLTATEITQKTGLVGGQLYHHLNNLENEKLITKANEKYKVFPGVQGMLLDIYNSFGFGLADTLWKLK
jgi:DNA-binding transcriptional ArsR family regulator